METIKLNAQKRDTKTLAKALRAEGIIPGICYGSGKENIAVQVNYQEFRKTYKQTGENMIIELDIDGTKHKVLVQELQFDPIYNTISHVDFRLVNMKEKVDTFVPIVFVGESPAVKEQAGTLNVALDEIEVRCLPGNIPHEFTVDISSLVDFHSVIHISDIKAPEGVEILSDIELSIATVIPPQSEDASSSLTPEELEKAAVVAAAGAEPERPTSTKDKKNSD